jgi:hypothetical protein
LSASTVAALDIAPPRAAMKTDLRSNTSVAGNALIRASPRDPRGIRGLSPEPSGNHKWTQMNTNQSSGICVYLCPSVVGIRGLSASAAALAWRTHEPRDDQKD